MKENPVFWIEKVPEAFSREEWESVCDGCARCCLQKLEDEETGVTWFTRIACRLLDLDTCRCSDYENRFEKVSDCTQVAPLTDDKEKWLPPSCAYLTLKNGNPLPSWHPLVSGDPMTIHTSDMSVRDWAIAEEWVDESQYEDLVIEFDEEGQPFST